MSVQNRRPHSSSVRRSPRHMSLILQCCAAGSSGMTSTHLKHGSIRRAQRCLVVAIMVSLALVLGSLLHEFWLA